MSNSNQAHPDLKIHRCDRCSYSTTRTSCLKHHIATNHATDSGVGNVIRCDQCVYQTFTQKLLQKHQRVVHGPGKKRAERDNRGNMSPTTTTTTTTTTSSGAAAYEAPTELNELRLARISPIGHTTTTTTTTTPPPPPASTTPKSGPFHCPKCSYNSASYYFYVRHLRRHSTGLPLLSVSIFVSSFFLPSIASSALPGSRLCPLFPAISLFLYLCLNRLCPSDFCPSRIFRQGLWV